MTVVNPAAGLRVTSRGTLTGFPVPLPKLVLVAPLGIGFRVSNPRLGTPAGSSAWHRSFESTGAWPDARIEIAQTRIGILIKVDGEG